MCIRDSHIHECGFHDWKKEDARNTVLYAEYRNYPASSADTTSNNRSLNDDIHCIDGRCIPYPHRAEYVCELDAVQAGVWIKQDIVFMKPQSFFFIIWSIQLERIFKLFDI